MTQIARLRDPQIENGQPNNATDVDVELNQLVAAHNDQDTQISTINNSASTFAGLKTFSAGIKTDVIDERTSNTGVTVDSVLLKDGMAKVAGTPTVDGQIGYASNQFLFRENGVNNTLINYYSAVFDISSNSTAGTTSGQLLLCTGFITISLTATASLSAQWFGHISNVGTGLITIDPNGSETIDGVTTISLYPGESCTVLKTGSGTFRTIGMVRQREVMIFSQTASNSTTIDFTGLDNSAFQTYIFRLKNVVPITDATSLWCRFSTDGGSSYAAGALDYIYSGDWVDSAGGGANNINSTGAAQIQLSPTNLMGNSTGEHYSLSIEFPNPSSSLSKSIHGTGGGYSSTPRSVTTRVSGTYVGSASGVNAIRFLMSSGNISSGIFECIGMRL